MNGISVCFLQLNHLSAHRRSSYISNNHVVFSRTRPSDSQRLCILALQLCFFPPFFRLEDEDEECADCNIMNSKQHRLCKDDAQTGPIAPSSTGIETTASAARNCRAALNLNVSADPRLAVNHHILFSCIMPNERRSPIQQYTCLFLRRGWKTWSDRFRRAAPPSAAAAARTPSRH